MQSFLPFPDFARSANCLDRQRLGKQRVEAKQISLANIQGPTALFRVEVNKGRKTRHVVWGPIPHIIPDGHEIGKTPWYHHPATKIWRNHNGALIEYGIAVCKEWRRRGYNDSLLQWFEERREQDVGWPTLIGCEAFHVSHMSNLIRKNPTWYGPLFPGVPNDLPYVWA